MASQASDCPKGPEGVKVAKLRELFQSTSATCLDLPQRIVTDTVNAEVPESAKKTRHSQSTPDKPKAQDGK